MPPWAWIGSVSGVDHLAVGGGRAEGGRGSRPWSGPVTVRQSPCSSPASSSSAITTGTPPIRSRSAMWYLPWGLMSARWGTRAADPVEVVERQLHPGLVGDGQQVQDGVGRAAEGHDHGDGVLERLLGHDLSRGGCRRRSRSTTARPEAKA